MRVNFSITNIKQDRFESVSRSTNGQTIAVDPNTISRARVTRFQVQLKQLPGNEIFARTPSTSSACFIFHGNRFRSDYPIKANGSDRGKKTESGERIF